MNINSWLEMRDTQDMLLKASRSVAISVISRNLSPGFFRQNNNPYETLLEEIRSELILFILEYPSKIQTILLSGNSHSLYLLKKSFIRYWIAKTRKPADDLQRYLYKHTADLLRVSEKFHTSVKKNGNGLTFSQYKNPGAESVAIPPLASEDIKAVPFPDQYAEHLDYEHIKQKRILLDLAAHFCQEVSHMWGDKPVRVDLRDFVNWLGFYVPLSMPVQSLNENYLTDMITEHPESPDKICFNPELVKKWARNFANCLNEKEKSVFLLRYGYDLSLKDIAEKLGYKGSSGPKYPLERAENELGSFLRDLPWLSPDDLNREAFALFHETLILILKQMIRKERISCTAV